MISIIVNVILLIIIGAMGYVIYNLNTKLKMAETWIESFIMKVLNIQEELKNVDGTGHFEADDEVGFVFKAIQQIIDTLAHLLVNETEQED